MDTKKIKKKMIKSINLKKKTKTKNYRYTGTLYQVFIGILYLLDKYKNLGIIFDESKKYDNLSYNKFLNKISIRYEINKNNKNNKMKINLPVIKNKHSNTESDFIKILKTYKYDYGINILYIDFGDNIKHYNIILYNFKNKIVERFDSNINIINNNLFLKKKMDKFDSKFKKLLKKNNLKYFVPKCSCNKNWQDLENENLVTYKSRLGISLENTKLNIDPEGYCGIWIIYYIDIRLKYNKLDSTNLIDQITNIMKTMPIKLRRFIRDYKNYIFYKISKIQKKTKMGDIYLSNLNNSNTNKKKDFFKDFVYKYFVKLISNR